MKLVKLHMFGCDVPQNYQQHLYQVWFPRNMGPICAMVKSRYIGDGHPTFNRNPYNGYINPYYWVDDHTLLYGTIGSLDPSTFNDLCSKGAR